MLGYLDDLLIVPLGILLVVKLIPPPLMAEFRAEGARRDKPVSKAGLAFVIAIWVVFAAVIGWWAWIQFAAGSSGIKSPSQGWSLR